MVAPAHKTLFAGSATAFPFEAQVKGASKQPSWVWSIESFKGQSHPPGGGSITQGGAYTPPAVALQTRIYRIRATAADNASLTGTALVRVQPPLGTAALHKILKSHGLQLADGPRIEHLAGGVSFEVRLDAPTGQDARVPAIHV